jgi:hypothetical protein
MHNLLFFKAMPIAQWWHIAITFEKLCEELKKIGGHYLKFTR